jgi:hypothetical protein
MLRAARTLIKPVTRSQNARMVATLPFADITVNSPGFGAMGINAFMGTNLSLEQAEPVLLKAIELGCTFWDTAVGTISIRNAAGLIFGFRSSTKPE